MDEEKQAMTQLVLGAEAKRKLRMIAEEENRTMSASMRMMINNRYDQLFVGIPKIDRIGFASGKIINHEPAHAPVEVLE